MMYSMARDIYRYALVHVTFSSASLMYDAPRDLWYNVASDERYKVYSTSKGPMSRYETIRIMAMITTRNHLHR